MARLEKLPSSYILLVMTNTDEVKKDSGAWFQSLCPDLTPDELEKAEDRLDRYLAIASRIYERMEEEKAAQLTEQATRNTVDYKVEFREKHNTISSP